ncbi:hypothetical protein AMAG_16701 [Allomyces macrogynus ATCC 38327]|uniref:DUF7789 domain-containing protein n=1 Tax=Allomyces macrogynus (strain ATCC 38327) TaxID=578462 RepID=A0A0L0TBN1_ALLM3|nr:hypothetical protein AMAG_16701 [Allomyces macrogynus ATCC 38327]|eukprot:KNE72218.1 hypothetical protein AMAG_16701 [Allomyces macrogynus ATCC 38327]
MGHETRMDKLRSAWSNSAFTRNALISSAAQAVVQLVLEIAIAIDHQGKLAKAQAKAATLPNFNNVPINLGHAVSVYHYIYMIATLLQLFFTFDSVLNQNSIELVALNIINLGLFGYSIIQYTQAQTIFGDLNKGLKDRDPTWPALAETSVFHIPSMVVSLVFLLGTAWLAYKLHREYGWAIYKRIGADIGLRRQMMAYFFLMMIIKIDVFFYFTFSLQFLVIGFLGKSDSTDMTIHIVVSVVMIFVLVFLVIRGTRTESDWYMWAFMAGTIACMAYLSYKFYQALTEDRFLPVVKSISFSIVLCLLVALVTLINAFICFRNFGAGLIHYIGKDAHERRRQQEAAAAAAAADMRPSDDGTSLDGHGTGTTATATYADAGVANKAYYSQAAQQQQGVYAPPQQGVYAPPQQQQQGGYYVPQGQQQGYAPAGPAAPVAGGYGGFPPQAQPQGQYVGQ